MDVLLVLVVLVLAVLLIVAPLLAERGAPEEAAAGPRRAELEAAKEAKYREIRDAELDYRTGKLDHDDWQQLDAGLRADALELLHRIDDLERAGEGAGESG